MKVWLLSACGLLSGALFQEKSVEELVEQLSSDKPETRDAATGALRKMGPGVLVRLRALRERPDSESRARISRIISDFEWEPLLPPGFNRHHADGLDRLRSGTLEERLRFVHRLAEEGLLPPPLAERIIAIDPDPWIRLRAGFILLLHPRERFRASYYRLFEDWLEFGTLDRPDPDFGEPLFFQDRFLKSLYAICSPSDRSRLASLGAGKSPDARAAVQLFMTCTGETMPNEAIEKIARAGDTPVSALAWQVLARKAGPRGIDMSKVPLGRLAPLAKGLVENGSQEACAAMIGLVGTCGRSTPIETYPLLAKLGSVAAARVVMSRLLEEWRALQAGGALGPVSPKSAVFSLTQALLEFAPGVIVEILKDKDGWPGDLLVGLGSPILFAGDERLVLALFNSKSELMTPPPSLAVGREVVTKACTKVVNTEVPAWARVWAYRHLTVFSMSSSLELTRKALSDDAHPLFWEALPHLSDLTPSEQKALAVKFAPRVARSRGVSEARAFAACALPEWLGPLLESAEQSPAAKNAALAALGESPGLTPEDRLGLARKHPLYARDLLCRQIPAADHGAVRAMAQEATDDMTFLSLASALVSSGDTTPCPRALKLLAAAGEAPATGLPTICAILYRKQCKDDLLGKAHLAVHGARARATEIVRTLGAYTDADVEHFLMDRLDEPPDRLLTGEAQAELSDRADVRVAALEALVNFRSGRLRDVALELARSSESEKPTFFWSAIVRALGPLEIQGACADAVSWLEASFRSDSTSEVDDPYLQILGYLGDDSHTTLVRSYLEVPRMTLLAARVLDRLTHRKEYRQLSELKEIPGLVLNSEVIAAELRKTWNLTVRISGGVRDAREFVPKMPIFRGTGFELLDSLADLLGLAPLWTEQGVIFLSKYEAREHWRTAR